MRTWALFVLAVAITVAPTMAGKDIEIPGGSGSGSGSSTISARIPVPAHVSGEVTASGCQNNPGPFITLTGELSLGEIAGRLIFRNNTRGTHTHEEDVFVDVILLPAGETIRFAKQPPQGGVGGNPYIYLQFLNGDGQPISDEVLLGRCVQGLSDFDLGLLQDVDAALDVVGGSCKNSPGPYIRLEGELTLGGLNARLIFRNNPRGTHEHDEFIGVDITILPAGESIQFAKQPPLDGVGGNPYIYFQFLGSDGPVGDPLFIGRCNQLGL